MRCEICATEIARRPSQLIRSQHNYCSNGCRYKGQSLNRSGQNAPSYDPNLDFICEYCGTVFHRKKTLYNRGKHHFCSKPCKGKWQSAQQMGLDNPNWKGNFNTYHWYGENWKRQRRRVRQRDSHTCRMCGITETILGRALDVHHVFPFFSFTSYKKANRLSNLISVCHKCHGLLEKNNGNIPRQPLFPSIK